MNEEKLNELVGQVMQDLGGANSVPLVNIGEKLGIYSALAAAGPSTAASLAAKTGLFERYLQEWLCAQAASNYVTWDAESETFSMTPEQAFIFANRDSPVYLTPAFALMSAVQQNEEKVMAAFQTGGGVAWGDQATCLSCAIAEFFRPGYEENLVNVWIPSLSGVAEKLEKGARVVDIGCGHGISTIIMAKAFPNSEFIGLDFHAASIEAAREHAADQNLGNLSFETALAKEADGGFDFVTMFDCLHDMGDPVGALKHITGMLNEGGSCMIVEPMAGDTIAENLNPVGRLNYSASTMICVPTSLAQEEGLALGAAAGEKRLREVVVGDAGYSHFARVAETPFNLVLEARP